MANICENEIHFSSTKKNVKYIIKYIEDAFNCDIDTDMDIDEAEDNEEINVSGFFDSRWTFPSDSMDEMYEGIPDKEDISIDVLSTEWGEYYCEFHHCDKDGWTVK